MEKHKHFHKITVSFKLNCQGITLNTSKNQVLKVLLIFLPCKISLVINFPNLQGIYLYLKRIFPSDWNTFTCFLNRAAHTSSLLSAERLEISCE